MPKEIALILCLAFIFWLLRLELKQHPDVSKALWIPTIWMLLVAGKPLATWFGTPGTSMEEGSALDRYFIIALLVTGLIILQKRRFNWGRTLGDYWWIFLLIGFMLISILWSEMPYASIKRWVREAFAPLAMAFIILTEKDRKQAVKSVVTRLIYVHIPLSLMLIKYYPYLGVEYGRWSGRQMWIGVATQKNGLTALCLLSTFFLIWTLVARRRKKEKLAVRYLPYVQLFLLALTIWLFMGPEHSPTYSATSAVALMIGLFLFSTFLWLHKRGMRLSPGILTIGVTAIIVYGTITPFVGKLTIFDPSDLLGRAETLTGRTQIWAALTPFARSSPILGYGFGGLWTDRTRELAGSSNAHNGYLEVILATGFAGLILWTIYMIFLSRRAGAETSVDPDWGILWCCILVMGLVHNIAESSMQSLYGTLQGMLLLLLASRGENPSLAEALPQSTTRGVGRGATVPQFPRGAT